MMSKYNEKLLKKYIYQGKMLDDADTKLKLTSGWKNPYLQENLYLKGS